jgi:uncharacterized protein YkwD
LRSIRTTVAALAAPIAWLGTVLSRHRAVTRVTLAAVAFTLVVGLSQMGSIQAGPQRDPAIPESLLPQNVGMAVETNATVTIPFDGTVDPGSVHVLPGNAGEVSWNEDGTALTVRPERLWRTDESYLVVVPPSADGADAVSVRSPRRFSFTTETAPTVTEFQVRLAEVDARRMITASTDPEAMEPGVEAGAALAARDALRAQVAEEASQPPTRAADEVSAATSISVSFSEEMNTADVEDRFAISPNVPGTFEWREGDMVFTPTERLQPSARYTVSLVGAHDVVGNELGGKGTFSFTVKPGAQLTTTDPKPGATGIEPAAIEMWFTQPMDVAAATAAFAISDSATGATVAGALEWNTAGTQATFVPETAFAPGSTFEVTFGAGARDADRNAVEMSWSFTTAAAPASTPTPEVRATTSTRTAPVAPPSAAAPVVPPAAPASSAAGYAVNQINAARAAYGFGPVVLDGAISAVAYAHAYDQAVNGYFSHTGLNGSTRDSRLQAGGISYGWSGENQCYLVGRSPEATLDWCHAQFMSEPYPGHWNHIANVLSPNARRVGVGIAQVGSKIVIVWDFTD